MSDWLDIGDERQLSAEEVSHLVSQFLEEHPRDFDKWGELEGGSTGVEPIWETIIAFLKRHCRYGTRTDLETAAFAMRGEFYAMSQSRNRRSH